MYILKNMNSCLYDGDNICTLHDEYVMTGEIEVQSMISFCVHFLKQDTKTL